MATRLDLDIDEGSTFIMAIEFWYDEDNTQPIDITEDSFTGTFKFGEKLIPMTLSISPNTNNVISASVHYGLMGNLTSSGKYDIDQLSGNAKFRLLQGVVRVNQEVTI